MLINHFTSMDVTNSNSYMDMIDYEPTTWAGICATFVVAYILKKWIFCEKQVALKCRYVDLVAEDMAAKGPYHFIDGCPVVTKSNQVGYISSYDEEHDKYLIRMENSDQIQEFESKALKIPTIQDLFIYPIKSCAGIRLSQAKTHCKFSILLKFQFLIQFSARGFENDRLYMFVNKRHRFLCQRKFPKLALISPTLPDQNNAVGFDEFDQTEWIFSRRRV